jgi:hypothetical protein
MSLGTVVQAASGGQDGCRGLVDAPAGCRGTQEGRLNWFRPVSPPTLRKTGVRCRPPFSVAAHRACCAVTRTPRPRPGAASVSFRGHLASAKPHCLFLARRTGESVGRRSLVGGGGPHVMNETRNEILDREMPQSRCVSLGLFSLLNN